MRSWRIDATDDRPAPSGVVAARRRQFGESHGWDNPRAQSKTGVSATVHARRTTRALGDMSDAAMTVNLHGVRSSRWPASPALKRLMARSLARRDLVSYEIITTAPSDSAPVEVATREKRSSARRRLRLRSAKLIDVQNVFLCECLVRDQSAQGLCLKLLKNVGLPTRCHLYDDETGAIEVVTTMWRRDTLLGIRYCMSATPVALKESDRAALRGRYYAVPD